MPAVPLLRPAKLLRIAGVVLIVALIALIPATPAKAHAQLLSTDPARDATLDTPPTRVTLEFSERLNSDYTTIVVTDADERPVPVSKPAVSGTRGTVTFTQPLADGVYTVAYRVISADGHPVQGSYSFTVAAGGDTPVSPAADQPAETATPSDVADQPAETVSPPATATPIAANDGWGAAGVAAGMVVLSSLVIGGSFLVWRRRSGQR